MPYSLLLQCVAFIEFTVCITSAEWSNLCCCHHARHCRPAAIEPRHPHTSLNAHSTLSRYIASELWPLEQLAPLTGGTADAACSQLRVRLQDHVADLPAASAEGDTAAVGAHLGTDLPQLPLAYLRSIRRSLGRLLGRATACSQLCEMGLVTGDEGEGWGVSSDEESEVESEEEEDDGAAIAKWDASNAAAASEWDGCDGSEGEGSCCGGEEDQEEEWGEGGERDRDEGQLVPEGSAAVRTGGLPDQLQVAMQDSSVLYSHRAEGQPRNNFHTVPGAVRMGVPGNARNVKRRAQPGVQRSNSPPAVEFPALHQLVPTQANASYGVNISRVAGNHFTTSQPSSTQPFGTFEPASTAPVYLQGRPLVPPPAYSAEETYMHADEVARMLAQVQDAAASQAPLSSSSLRAIIITPQHTAAER